MPIPRTTRSNDPSPRPSLASRAGWRAGGRDNEELKDEPSKGDPEDDPEDSTLGCIMGMIGTVLAILLIFVVSPIVILGGFYWLYVKITSGKTVLDLNVPLVGIVLLVLGGVVAAASSESNDTRVSNTCGKIAGVLITTGSLLLLKELLDLIFD